MNNFSLQVFWLVFLLGLTPPTGTSPSRWQRIPDTVWSTLGTAGAPQHLPVEQFTQPYAQHPRVALALRLYFKKDYHQAFRILNSTDLVAAKDAEVMAWRSLICFRQGNFAEARHSAYVALAADPDLGLAHEALAMSYNGQYRRNPDANKDSVRVHMARASELAPVLTTPWFVLWSEKAKQGDLQGQEECLEGMMKNRAFTPGLWQYTRWVMNSIPPKAVFLTNGDLDTYPLLALMLKENCRPDVAVVNLSLLNLKSYGQAVCSRAGLPWPVSDQDFADVASRRTGKGALKTRSSQIVRQWAKMYRLGELNRPLAWALSVPMEKLVPELAGQGLLVGGCYQYRPDPTDQLCDAAKTAASFEGLDPDLLMGNYLSPCETSPVLAASINFLAGNPVSVLFRLALQAEREGNQEQGWWALDFADRLITGGHLAQEFKDRLEKIDSR